MQNLITSIFSSFFDNRRNVLIDTLRGISIILVVVCHYQLNEVIFGGPEKLINDRTIRDIGNGMGYYGVSIFFVISGYLITTMTLRRYKSLSNIDCSAFWWMRFSRIMPIVLCCVCGMLLFQAMEICGFYYYSPKILHAQIMGIFAFRFNEVLWADPSVSAWGPLWSLSVEEIFYLVFPLACLLLKDLKAVFCLALVTISGSLFFKIVGGGGYGVMFATQGCLDLLALGVLTAALQPERFRTRFKEPVMTLIGSMLIMTGLSIIFFCIIIAHPSKAATWAPLLCGFGAAFALIGSQLFEMPPKFSKLLFPISTLGVVSYEIYVLHTPLCYLALPFWKPTTISFLLFLFLASIFIHQFFSEPMNLSLRKLMQNDERQNPECSKSNFKLIAGISSRFVCAALVVFLTGFWVSKMGLETKYTVSVDTVANLDPGAIEPIAYVGVSGNVDLIYLKHETSRLFRIGIDHSGGGGQIGPLMDSKELTGSVLSLMFAKDGVRVSNEKGLIVKTNLPAHRPLLMPHYGTNDVGYKEVLLAAQSKIVPH